MSNHYNRIAPYYDRISRLVFRDSIIGAQIEFLDRIPDEGRLLFIGGGSGDCLKAIAQQKPNLHICYVDASEKMIQLSQSKLNASESEHIEWICGTEADIPKELFDGIITFFFLDLFKSEQRKTVFQQLNHQLKAGGLWYYADFNPPTNLKERLLMWSMFLFLKLSTAIAANGIGDYSLLFEQNQFQKVASKHFYNGFIASKVYQKA